MITQTMLDFSKVRLSRRRKPYFIQRLQCWYFKDASGLPHRLHPDEGRALEIWRQAMGNEASLPNAEAAKATAAEVEPAKVKVKPGVLPPLPTKPMKPYRGFPLYAHPNGQWAKKINGRTLYFGPWSNWKRALEVYESLKPKKPSRPGAKNSEPRRPEPKPTRYKFDRTAPRARIQVMRVLKLLDALAAYRLPKSLREVHQLMNEATGCQWHEKTIERDLRLLDSMGLVDLGVVDGRLGFKLNLDRSERLQTVALAVFD